LFHLMLYVCRKNTSFSLFLQSTSKPTELSCAKNLCVCFILYLREFYLFLCFGFSAFMHFR
jgi:hypothetical protein